MEQQAGVAVARDVTVEDGVLIRRAQGGDAAAFGRLVERYMRRAYFAALSLVGTREDALDLSQEAFVRAFRARRTIDPERPFYAWLYQILRRLCFNFLRDRRNRRRQLESAGNWLAEEAAQRERRLIETTVIGRRQSEFQKIGKRDTHLGDKVAEREHRCELALELRIVR